MMPTFSVFIGSEARDTLKNSLDSIARQARVPGDQCIVGFDGRRKSSAVLMEGIRQVKSYGDGFEAYIHVGIADSPKFIPLNGPGGPAGPIAVGQEYSWLGVEQINHGLKNVPITGSHVFTIGDDDIFVDGAYEMLRPICERNPLRPVIYRFQAPNRWILWDMPRLRPCWISGCCIAAPYPFVGLHPTDIETTHDYRWIVDIVETARRYGKEPVWVDYVGVIARPPRIGQDVAHKGIWTCNCGKWGYLEHGMNTHCPCGADLWTDRELIVPPYVGNE